MSSNLGLMSIDGLFSNLKTSDIIAKIMQIERAPITALQSQQADLNKSLATFQDLNARLLALQSYITPLTNPTTFQSKSASSSDTSILTASAATNATNGTHSITVATLAQKHSLSSDALLIADASNQLGARFPSAFPGGAGSSQTFTITVNGVNTNVTIDYEDTLSEMRDKINQANAGVTAVIINDTSTTQKMVITSNSSGSTGAITFTDSADELLGDINGIGVLTNGIVLNENFNDGFANGWTANGGTWAVEPTPGAPDVTNVYSGTGNGANSMANSATFADATTNYRFTFDFTNQGAVGGLMPYPGALLRYVDSNNYLGVLLFGDNTMWLYKVEGGVGSLIASSPVPAYDAGNHNLEVIDTGVNITAKLDGVTYINSAYTTTVPVGNKGILSNINTHMHFDNVVLTDLSAASGIKNELTAAQDAQFTLDGLAITRSSNTVSDVLDGVTMNLLNVGGPVTLTISDDNATAQSSIQNFVDQYNNLIGFFKDQFYYDESTKTGGQLLGDTVALNIQSELQNIVLTTIDPLLYTDSVGVGTGSKGAISGDFKLNKPIIDYLDVQELTVNSVKYNVRAVGGAYSGGGNQVEVASNGNLQFFDNNGVAVNITNGYPISANYKVAEVVSGVGGAVKGDYDLYKTINNIYYVDRIVADVGGTTRYFQKLGINTLANGQPTSKADGYYVEVDTSSGATNGELQFFQVAGGIATAINVDNGTVKAVYKGANDYATLTDIGITTTSYQDPSLTIDSSKLSAALSNNREGVQNLFASSLEALANKIKDYLNQLTQTDGTLSDVQTGIQDQIDSIGDEISSLEELMQQKEDALRKQFIDMEVALGLMQSQMTQISALISRLPTSFSSSILSSTGSS